MRETARAYAGDLVVARVNDNHLEAGEPGRTLANGDLLRVESIGGRDLTVSRLTRTGQAGGQITWSAPFTLARDYAASSCDLGYALTWYTVEGQTVSAGIALASDTREREGLYVAMTRGQHRNEVYAYPAADAPGESLTREPHLPDPEIARQRMLQADRESTGPAAAAGTKDPISILARVVRRDGAQLSATETREQALSDADHLGALHAIWQDQHRAEAYTRYAQAVREHAASANADEILTDTDTLWRTVRTAELAGLDGAEVIRKAIAGRSFTGARSHSAVLDARIRNKTGHLPPAIRQSWTADLPKSADPDMTRYLTEIAAAMDDRQCRIGEHATRERPLWATQALGQMPGDPARRADWERRAGQLGAYREITGWDNPGEAIGPEPAATSPEARAEWHTAFAAMARVEGIDVRHLTDGQLLARRRAYETETSWAPKHVAEELRAGRRQEHSRIEATRHSYEAAAAARHGHAQQAALHEHAARSWTALGQRAAQVRDKLAEAHDTRSQWEAMTEPPRRFARAADLELKRRGVLAPDDHLKSAEPEGFTYPRDDKTADTWVQPRLDGSFDLPRDPEPLAPDKREERALQVLGLTLDHEQPELPLQVTEIADYNRQRQAEIDQRRTMRIPAEEPGEMDLGEAWNVLAVRRRDAVIQPPKPPIPAAEAVRERAAEREAG